MGARSRSRLVALVLSLAAVHGAVLPRAALAQQGDKATAEALFNEGKRLMADKRYADACPKFAASHQLDPGVGALLNLAVCYEANGQTASAWATYKDAVSMATSLGQSDRAALARARAAQLEPLLAKLTIVVDKDALLDGLEIRRDAAVVPMAGWGVAVPVDPGEHVVDARAPKHKARTYRVQVAGKAQASVKIDPLEPEAEAEPPPPPPPPPPPASTTPPVPIPPASSATVAPPPPASSARPPDSVAPPPPEPKSSIQSTLGSYFVVFGTLGLVGGGFAALAAKLQYDDSNGPGKCTNDQCTQKGLDQRDTAFLFGNIATGGIIGGGALLVGGIVLLATAPKDNDAQAPPSTKAIHVTPGVAKDGASVWVSGSW